MHAYQREFLDFVISTDVLRFGKFTLKSGRVSPYFFNSGLFNRGSSIAKLGRYYAAAIENSGIEYTMIFGPAYKGIPLAVSTVSALADHHNHDVHYAFNRKEVKDHGEGGNIVGASLTGKVLIIDDVISAGTSVRESIEIIDAAGASTAGVVIALDRQEKGQGDRSAIQEVEQQFKLPVASIVKLDDLISYLGEKADMDSVLHDVRNYREQYGVLSSKSD